MPWPFRTFCPPEAGDGGTWSRSGWYSNTQSPEPERMGAFAAVSAAEPRTPRHKRSIVMEKGLRKRRAG